MANHIHGKGVVEASRSAAIDFLPKAGLAACYASGGVIRIILWDEYETQARRPGSVALGLETVVADPDVR